LFISPPVPFDIVVSGCVPVIEGLVPGLPPPAIIFIDALFWPNTVSPPFIAFVIVLLLTDAPSPPFPILIFILSPLFRFDIV